MLLSIGEQARLRSAVNERVKFLAQDELGARKGLYQSLYRAIKERYGVTTYKKLRQDQLQNALKFIYSWGGGSE